MAGKDISPCVSTPLPTTVYNMAYEFNDEIIVYGNSTLGDDWTDLINKSEFCFNDYVRAMHLRKRINYDINSRGKECATTLKLIDHEDNIIKFEAKIQTTRRIAEGHMDILEELQMSSRESPMNLGSDDSDDEINAAYFREEVIYCALMKRWQHIALLYSELPKEHGPGRSTTSTPMEKLVNYARKALYAEGNGRTNLHVIPPFWQPSDDLYLLLSFLELGDVAYCNPDYFSRRFSIADRKLRLNAILENEVLRR